MLAGLVAPMVFRNVGDAKVSAAKAQIELFALALDAYRLDNDFYPSTAQGLAALRSRPAGEPEARNWRGPYLRKEIPLDPWGRPAASRRDLVIAFQSIGALVSAGVPLARAVGASELVTRGALRETLRDAQPRLREGQSFAEALSSGRGVVPDVVLGMIRAGERG